MTPRRFPHPGQSRNKTPASRNRGGQALAYVYFEDEPGRRSAAKLLERDEARRFAVNIAKQPRISRISAIKPEDRAFGVKGDRYMHGTDKSTGQTTNRR
jgi:hypothetical protein